MRIAGSLVLAVAFMGRVDAAPRRSDLSPEAAVHNDRAVALLNAGDPAAAVPELLAAYAAMPDPLRWRAGRGKVLGSLRGALRQLYTSTHDPRHLCTLQRLLREHIEGLLLALGDTAGPDAVAGSLARLREVDAELVGHDCAAPAKEVMPVPPVLPVVPAPVVEVEPPPSPVRAPAATPLRDTGRPLRIAGGSLLGVGFVGVSGMVLGAIFYADSRAHLQAITAVVAAEDREPSATERRDAGAFLRQGQQLRALTIVSGVIGGVAVIAGAVLRARGLRRARATAGVGMFGLRF